MLQRPTRGGDHRAGRRRHLAAAVVIGAVLSGITLVAGARPALACSCAAPGSPASEIEQHDAVFLGTAVEALDADGVPARFRGGAVAYVFEVSGVHRGQVWTTQQVGSSGPGSACGYEFEVGREYLVFAHTMREEWSESARAVPAGELLTGYCTPTAPVDAVALDTLPSPGAPIPGEHRYLAAASGLEQLVRSAPEQRPAVWWVAVAVAAIVVVLGAVRASRRLRRTVPPS